ILSMPYAMLSSILPSDKMGYYMGVFNFFIVIPQIVAAGILGFMLKSFFGNVSIYALIIGGISLFLAGLLCLIVEDKEE
ncbi:MAG: MFS transporter, partial [Bacteroidia bacterium]|nr:MFS transporter [Bacteroidia bacterium]